MFWYSKESPACVSWVYSTLWNTCNISMHIILIKRKKKKIFSLQLFGASQQAWRKTCMKMACDVPHLYQLIPIQACGLISNNLLKIKAHYNSHHFQSLRVDNSSNNGFPLCKSLERQKVFHYRHKMVFSQNHSRFIQAVLWTGHIIQFFVFLNWNFR